MIDELDTCVKGKKEERKLTVDKKEGITTKN